MPNTSTAKPAKTPVATATIRPQILALAARPEGMHSTDFPGVDSNALLRRVNELIKEGKLYKARVSFKRVLYFTDAARARAAQQEGEAKAAAATQAAALACQPGKFAKDAQVVYTKQTKYTKCPTPPQRFSAIETPNIYSANQRGRISQRNAE